jgi:hypothetical protein
LLLPIGCLSAEVLYNHILRRACSLYYYKPKAEYRALFSDELVLGALPEHPLLFGDIEAAFGSVTALVVLSIENAKFVAGLLEVMYRPSRAHGF